jgi:hypothetical protein
VSRRAAPHTRYGDIAACSPAPCDDCPSRERCARAGLACLAFTDYGHRNRWRPADREREIAPLGAGRSTSSSSHDVVRLRPVRAPDPELLALAASADDRGLSVAARSMLAAQLMFGRPKGQKLLLFTVAATMRVSVTSLSRAQRRLRELTS